MATHIMGKVRLTVLYRLDGLQKVASATHQVCIKRSSVLFPLCVWPLPIALDLSLTKKMMFARLVDACEALFAFPVGFEFYPKLTTREIKKIASACSIAGRSNMSGKKLGSVLAKTYQKLREIAH